MHIYIKQDLKQAFEAKEKLYDHVIDCLSFLYIVR